MKHFFTTMVLTTLCTTIFLACGTSHQSANTNRTPQHPTTMGFDRHLNHIIFTDKAPKSKGSHIYHAIVSNPDAYIESNIIGFYNILEACRHSYDDGERGVEHLVYASSSSVYGANKQIPYSTDDKVDNPVSLYAATKKSNELLAYSYAKLYNIPSTGLRFFTVYGPAGRPDMAYFGFTNTLRNGGTIKIFNYGNCKRDFTYIDDIVEGVSKVMSTAPERRNGADGLPVPPYAIYNIGNSNPENLLDFVRILSEELVSAGVLSEDYNFEEHKELVPMQPGDVPVTYADTSALEADFGFKPNTTLREGLKRFAIWYKDFYMMEGK